VFERIRHEAMNPEDLIGTIWALTSLDGEGPVEGSIITLGFHDDRHASGHAGCREYAASYQASGDEIRFPSLTMTGDESCLADEALYRQEGRYTDALSWATRYRVSEEALEIWTARGEVLLYEPGLPGGEPDAEGSRPCEAYQELTAKAGSVERRAVVTSYRCQNATIDSTGQSPANPPDLTLEAGGRLEFHLGAGEVPDRLELRLYPEAGIASTFFRWPEELPLEIEPVDRVEPEPGLAFEYRPEGPAGAYSLVVRATWGEAVDVFYALSFEVR
jgi:heat shock protein HslJ